MKYLLLIFLLTAYTAQAATYYFSTTDGDDGRTAKQAQNSATPWKTLDKFNAARFAPGDVVLFKRGDVFYGTLTIAQSGSSGASITIGAYGNGPKPVLTGFVTVADWTNTGNNIWESNAIAEAPANFRPTIVLTKGTVMPIGRYPNYDPVTKGYLYYESANDNISVTDNDMPANPDWTGAEIVIRKNRYVLDIGTITGQAAAGSGSTFTYTGTSNNKPAPGFGYFIQNDIRTLDADGEWYFDAASRKLKMYARTKPGTTKIGIQPNLIYANAKSYITIQDMAFEGSKGDAVLLAGVAANDTVRNCEVTNIGGWGINISKLTNSAVQRCTLTNILDGGISSSMLGNNNYIGYNTLTNIAYIPGAASNGAGSAALNNGGTGTVTEYNSIDNTGYIGIKFGSTNSVVRYNRIKNFCTIKDDGGGLYRNASIANQSNIKIYNNIISDGIGAPQGTNSPNSAAEGIYADDNENGISIYNNTLFNISHAAIYLHNANHITVTGNLIYNCGLGFRSRGASDFTFTGNTIVATNTASYLMHLYNKSAAIADNGNIDSNYYYQPSPGAIRVEVPSGKNYPFAAWRTAYPVYDVHSRFNQVPANSSNAIRFEYNATAAPVSVALGAPYKDVTGTDYSNGRLVLAPYTSSVLIKADRNGAKER